MKVPITISLIILTAVMGLTFYMNRLAIKPEDFLGLAISSWAAAGALISVVFVVYGYLMSLAAFVESQKPKLLVFVDNGNVHNIDTNAVEHQTRINYRNIGSIECSNLNLYAKLVSDSEEIEIPRLFSRPINLQVGDSRTRDFPTISYFRSNGIDQAVINNMHRYELVIGYSVQGPGEVIERNYEYEWNPQVERWNIA